MDLSPAKRSRGLSPAPPLRIEEAAGLAGSWAWAEGSLYEVVGGWARSTANPSAKVYFDACSQHHAWRAQLWQERLPARLVATRAAGDDLVRPASDGAVQAVKALSCLEGDVERLAAYTRVVLARTVVAYRAWQNRCADGSDRPVARALGFAIGDALADWEQGAGLLVQLLDGTGSGDSSSGPGGPAGGEALVRAAEASSELERLLVGGGLAAGA
jgi:hypothetical protein